MRLRTLNPSNEYARHPKYFLFVVISASLLIPTWQTSAGVFLKTDEGTDVITHPLGYTGIEINQVLVITVGIDPASPDAMSMIRATRQAVATWNALSPKLNNEVPGGESPVPLTQADFESVLVHELGHTLRAFWYRAPSLASNLKVHGILASWFGMRASSN